MADTKYTKSVSTDFSSGVDAGKFDEEIRASSISSAALLRVNISGDDCDSWFDDPLSSGDETTFDSLVSAHDGTPQVDFQDNHEAYALDEDRDIAIEKDVSGNMLFKDDLNTTSVSLTTLLSGGGISASTHKTLRQLIHFISDGPAEGFPSGCYKEVTGTVFPTSIIWWESSSKLKKIIERTITWTGVNATTDEWKMYDSDGTTLLVTISDSISYSGVFESNRTRTITVH